MSHKEERVPKSNFLRKRRRTLNLLYNLQLYVPDMLNSPVSIKEGKINEEDTDTIVDDGS